MDNSPTPANVGTLPLGTLAHDGPATPEQISLVLPVTNTAALPADTATATVRYRPAGTPDWIRAQDVAMQARAELERTRDRN